MIYDNEISYEQMVALAKKRECKCGGSLLIAWGGYWGYDGYVLRCAHNIEHKTLEKKSFRKNPWGKEKIELSDLGY